MVIFLGFWEDPVDKRGKATLDLRGPGLVGLSFEETVDVDVDEEVGKCVASIGGDLHRGHFFASSEFSSTSTTSLDAFIN